MRCVGMAFWLSRLLNDHILVRKKWERRSIALMFKHGGDVTRFGVQIDPATLDRRTFPPLYIIYVQPLVPHCLHIRVVCVPSEIEEFRGWPSEELGIRVEIVPATINSHVTMKRLVYRRPKTRCTLTS